MNKLFLHKKKKKLIHADIFEIERETEFTERQMSAAIVMLKIKEN